MGKDTVFSRRQVEGFIAEGKVIIIVDGKVLRLDSWTKFHPGGEKAILHMVGKDATCEVNALHGLDTLLRMDKFQIGRIEGGWDNFLPPFHGGKFRPYVEGEQDESAICSDEEFEAPSPISLDGSGSTTPSIVSSDYHGFILDPSISRRKHGSSASSITSISKDSVTFTDESSRQLGHDPAGYPRLTQKTIVEKYRQLDRRIRAEGLYDCRYSCYLLELARYLVLLSTSLALLHCGWYKLSALFIGLFWHQIAFTAHDAGHIGITHNFTVDSLIGIFVANVCGGLSIGWWKLSHNVHHIVTNEPEHDPDIQHLPFFAVSHKFFESLFSTYYGKVLHYDFFAKTFVKFQNWLYYPVLCFGRFNLYRLSWEYLIFGYGPKRGIAWWHRWAELAGMVVFWYWFGFRLLYLSIPSNWDRFIFVMISHMVTMPLHVQITLSHFAMSTVDLGVRESFPEKMLRTTMDVDCPQWLDFIHGGLQFQVIHHLFPRIPRHNLRRTQKIVMEFCKEVGIRYTIYGFVKGNRKVLGRLGDIGEQAKILAECQASMIAKGAYDHL